MPYQMQPDQPITVYRIYAADNQLLYIGQSQNPMGRIGHHRFRTWDWGNEVHHWTFEEFPNRESAVRAERLAILQETPIHNKQVANPWKIGPIKERFNPWEFAQFCRVQFEAGDITLVEAVGSIERKTGVDTRKAFHWLGLDDGGYECKRTHKTFDQLVALNVERGLLPATVIA